MAWNAAFGSTHAWERMLGGERLPNGTRISFDIAGEQTYSMTLDDFIEHATLISE